MLFFRVTRKPESSIRGALGEIRIRESGVGFSNLERRKLQIWMVAGFAEVVERREFLVAGPDLNRRVLGSKPKNSRYGADHVASEVCQIAADLDWAKGPHFSATCSSEHGPNRRVLCRAWSPILEAAACSRARSVVQAHPAHHLFFGRLPGTYPKPQPTIQPTLF
jgi:hypothetical protein